MSVPTRILLASTILVVVVHLAFSTIVYGDLPARIPTHFNAAGVADGFGARSNWWLLPMIDVASAALTIGVSLVLPSRPDLLNLPSKPEILALPRDAQIEVVRTAQPGLLMLSLMVAGTFLFLQYATWQVAQGRSATGIGNLILIVPIVTIAVLPAILVPVSRELRRQRAVLAAPRRGGDQRGPVRRHRHTTLQRCRSASSSAVRRAITSLTRMVSPAFSLQIRSSSVLRPRYVKKTS